jgi:hypothetical protein
MASPSPLARPFDTSFVALLRSYSGLLRVRPAARPVETGSRAYLAPPFSILSEGVLDYWATPYIIYIRYLDPPCYLSLPTAEGAGERGIVS